ncbi:MAG: hypothetical protein R3337_00070 [Gammaproteobacteria bacterium]|nr:hypothetical protein [Gammaproteobacteria bacterium]
MASPEDRGVLADLFAGQILDGDDSDNPLPQRNKLRIVGHSGGLTDDTEEGATELDLSALGGGGGAGEDGADGAETFAFTFAASIIEADPGAGNVRFNSATYGSINELYVSETNADGASMATYFTRLQALATTPKASVRVFNKAAPERFAVFEITALTDNSGWWTLTVTYAGHDSAIATTAGDARLTFTRGAQAGLDGDDGMHGGERRIYTYDDDNQGDAVPGDGNLRLNNVDPTAATLMYIDLDDVAGLTNTAWLDSLANATGTNKGTLRLSRESSPEANFVEYQLTGVATASGYRRVSLTYRTHAGSLTDTAGDTIVSFTRAGDAGLDLPGGESFFYQFAQAVDATDPGAGYLKGNNVSFRESSELYVDDADQSTNPLADFLSGIPAGATVTVYQRNDKTYWAVFRVETVESSGGFHTITIRSNIGGRPGSWQFAADAELVFAVNRGGSGGAGVSTAAGTRALIGSFMRTHPFASLLESADRVAVWVPGYNHPLLIAFGDVITSEAAGEGTGYLQAYALTHAEGGLTGGRHSDDSNNTPGGWVFHGTVATVADEVQGRLAVLAVSAGNSSQRTGYVFVAANRTPGNGAGTNKLFRSVDGGRTWSSVTLNRTDETGPRFILATRNRLVVSYYATGGEIETSQETAPGNLGVNWTNRTVPNTNARQYGASDGDQTFVMLGSTGDFVYSTDEGDTIVASALPSLGAASIRGACYCNGRFYVMAWSEETGMQILWSADAIAWNGPTTVRWSNPNLFDVEPVLDRQQFVALGDYLVIMGKGDTPEKNDLFYCDTTRYPDGNEWDKSGAFAGTQLFNNSKPRIGLASSSPVRVGDNVTDRHLLMLLADQGSENVGGGEYAELFISESAPITSLQAPGGSSSSSSSSTATAEALIRQLFESATGMSAPSTNSFRLDNADPALATQMALDNDNIAGASVRDRLLEPGGLIAHIHNDDFTVDYAFQIAPAKTGNTGWVLWNVSLVGTPVGTLVGGAAYSLELSPRAFKATATVQLTYPTSAGWYLQAGISVPGIKAGRAIAVSPTSLADPQSAQSYVATAIATSDTDGEVDVVVYGAYTCGPGTPLDFDLDLSQA